MTTTDEPWADFARKSDVSAVQTELGAFRADLEIVRNELGSRITNVEKDVDKLYKAMSWVIGATTTFGIATVVLLVQLSFAVAGLK